MAGSSRVLVIGGTGWMGQHLVKASLAAGHPTTTLVRPASSSDHDDPGRLKLLEDFKARGATVIEGDIYEDHDGLVAAIKQSDIVISAVGHNPRDLEVGQVRILEAIKEAGNVRRFVPSEFGCDAEQTTASPGLLEPARSFLLAKVHFREAVRASGVPHTLICSYWAQSYTLPRLGDPIPDGPPTTKANVFGDDSTNIIVVNAADTAAVTIRAVDDPRTLDKILYVRPAANTCSYPHMVRLWEEKTGKVLDKTYVSEEELVARIRDSPLPFNFAYAMVHAVVGPTRMCHQIRHPDRGVEATELYPDYKYITIEDYLDRLKEGRTEIYTAGGGRRLYVLT